MKNFYTSLFLLLLLLGNKRTFSQYSASYLSYEYTEILVYSLSITYTVSDNYYPYTRTSFYANSLASSQSRYDYNHNIVSTEYGRLWNLELINNSNKTILAKYKAMIKNEIDVNSTHADFSKESITQEYISFISQPFNVPSIKDEIKLLQSCQTELNRIKYKDPNNYIYSKRYKAISKTLELLENCEPSQINNLSWEKTELENTTNTGNSSMSNTSMDYTSVNITLSMPIKDFDNNQYQTVQIGNQTWTTSNLKVANFRNGDSIFHAKTIEQWYEAGQKGIPAWCFSYNDASTKDNYGILYNWYAVNDPRGLAPNGWHIPTKSEFETLIDNLGGKKLAPAKIKGLSGWEKSNNNNQSKLNGVQTGMRNDCSESYLNFVGCYSGYCRSLNWWSSSPHENSKYTSDYAHDLSILDTDDQNTQLISSQSKKYGASVRLIKN
ncbi:MAG: fibrobacter succinogenes major paralogous domain-containing protein [Flavobacteriales bacterium]|nr:fibrobacter succinogenes major paralogous domain-containing protein [Flavobacteriales bacterium]